MSGIDSKYYKYFSVNENLLSVFLNREFWFADPRGFNDPFDLALDWHMLLEPIKTKLTRDGYLKLGAWLEDEIFYLHTVRVFCATSLFDDNVMWGHYADGHRGVCIGFSVASWDVPPELPLPVHYDLKHFEHVIEETVDFLEAGGIRDSNGSAKQAAKVAHAWVSTKGHQWAYEKEVRFIKPLDDPDLFLDPDSTPPIGSGTAQSIVPNDIDCVLFGLKAPEKNIKLVRNMLNYDDWKHVKFWQAHRSSTDPFGLDFHPLKT
jgi:hypothetical protein